MTNEQEHPWEAFSRWEQWLREYLSPMECDEWLDDLSTAEMSNLYGAFYVYHNQEIEQLRSEAEALRDKVEQFKQREKGYLCEVRDYATEVERLRDELYDRGFKPCDNPACNCGGWHE